MLYPSAQKWLTSKKKRIMVFGMSGLGKTYISKFLRDQGNWFHYNIDYRIGSRYLDEHIADNFKAEAMKNPFFANLLRSDSIYIASNLRFSNLLPLSSYLGKPGNIAKGGIPFDEYLYRQRLHLEGETNAMKDTIHFIKRAEMLYGYNHFICDTSGSMVEVVNPLDKNDPILSLLSRHVLPVWIKTDKNHTDILIKRFAQRPKPMYYQEYFLTTCWNQYLTEKSVTANSVDPDDFIRFGYRRLLEHRLPRYQQIAHNWGVEVNACDISKVSNQIDFCNLIAQSINNRKTCDAN